MRRRRILDRRPRGHNASQRNGSGPRTARNGADGAARGARKKSSQKSTRPRGAKDAVTFPGAIGRNNACVRADAWQVALGGSKRLPRVGECIVADGGPPCQRQPLRGRPIPSGGADPSTWFVGLVGDRRGWPECYLPRRQSLFVLDRPTTTCPAGPSVPRRGAAEYGRVPGRVKASFSTERPFRQLPRQLVSADRVPLLRWHR